MKIILAVLGVITGLMLMPFVAWAVFAWSNYIMRGLTYGF
jgi:hypothetical protein